MIESVCHPSSSSGVSVPLFEKTYSSPQEVLSQGDDLRIFWEPCIKKQRFAEVFLRFCEALLFDTGKPKSL
jgi:hypothetical protein